MHLQVFCTTRKLDIPNTVEDGSLRAVGTAILSQVAFFILWSSRLRSHHLLDLTLYELAPVFESFASTRRQTFCESLPPRRFVPLGEVDEGAEGRHGLECYMPRTNSHTNNCPATCRHLGYHPQSLSLVEARRAQFARNNCGLW